MNLTYDSSDTDDDMPDLVLNEMAQMMVRHSTRAFMPEEMRQAMALVVNQNNLTLFGDSDSIDDGVLLIDTHNRIGSAVWRRPSLQTQQPQLEYAYVSDVPTVDLIINLSMEGETDMWDELSEEFPGTVFGTAKDYYNFMTETTFFKTTSVPKDEDDVYGDPYTECDHVYTLVAPRHKRSEFYSSHELIGSFLEYKDFLNPKRTEERFTDKQMRRLSLLSKHKDQILHETIEQILFRQSSAMQFGHELYDENPAKFKECLQMILDTGMLMRGWCGEGEYPLRSEQTQREVDMAQLSRNLIVLQKELANSWNEYAKLPLMQYRNNIWRQSTDRFNLLKHRVQVVVNGNHPESCIRMTSNLFTSTAWLYLCQLYNEPKFDIDQLREIF